MTLTGAQWITTIVVGLLVGWILPAAMKETIIMPYGKGIVSGIVGALIGALIYDMATSTAITTGMLVLWTLIGALILYFIVRSVSKNKSTKA